MTTVRFGPTFTRLAQKLQRKYARTLFVVEKLADQLEAGNTPGDRIQGLSKVVYKVRLPNPDANRGKSGGYRVIYYIKTTDSIILLLIYAKVAVENVSVALIEEAIQEVDNLES